MTLAEAERLRAVMAARGVSFSGWVRAEIAGVPADQLAAFRRGLTRGQAEGIAAGLALAQMLVGDDAAGALAGALEGFSDEERRATGEILVGLGIEPPQSDPLPYRQGPRRKAARLAQGSKAGPRA